MTMLNRFKFLIFVLSVSALLSINGTAQERPAAGTSSNEQPPKVGLRITEVKAGSTAEEAGLQPMDVISRYGRYQIVDASSYFVAREAYEKFSASRVEIVCWRGPERIAIRVMPGRLGIEFDEYGQAAYHLGALMQSLTSHIELPPYWVESETAKGTIRPRDEVIRQIMAAIDRGEADGSLTRGQILVARINATPDDAPATAVERQSELIKKLIASQPKGFTNYLGQNIFYAHKRYRPAIACFKRQLESDPSDVSVRLNLGNAYFSLGMFAEAAATADHALTAEGLSEYGNGVAFQIKANAALGQRDFAAALKFAEKAFRANPRSDYLMSLWQFAAAQTGDLQKFYEVIAATEKALPKDYARLRGRTDAIEAYILYKNNQAEKARALAVLWARVDPFNSNPRYWKQYPTGDDVQRVWRQLVDQN